MKLLALCPEFRHAGALYALHYDLDLFSNFTYFLDDPIHGDQIEQHDVRGVFGGEAWSRQRVPRRCCREAWRAKWVFGAR